MKHPDQLASFNRSDLTVFMLTVVTAGLYSYYWFYRQWKAVGVRTETDTHPVLAAAFDFITSFKLFRQLLPEQLFSATILATIYLVLFGISLFFDAGEDKLGITLAIKFVTLLALAGIITTVHHYAQPKAKARAKTPFLPGEVVILVIGCYVALLSLTPLAFAPQSVTKERFSTIEIEMKKTSTKVDAAQSKQTKCIEDLNALAGKVDDNDSAASLAYETKKAECSRLTDETFALVKELLSYVPRYFYAMIR